MLLDENSSPVGSHSNLSYAIPEASYTGNRAMKNISIYSHDGDDCGRY